MEKMHGCSANSGQVGRKLSLADKAVIMWTLDTLADNSMEYVKQVRQVIERQTGFGSAQATGGGANAVVNRVAAAIRISRGISPEFVVWMREDQDKFVKGVVKTMMWLSADRYMAAPALSKPRYLVEYERCGDVLNRW